MRDNDRPASIRFAIKPGDRGWFYRRMTGGTGSTQSFLKTVDDTGFWTLPDGAPSLQGICRSHWILEGVRGGQYRVIDRCSPAEDDHHRRSSHPLVVEVQHASWISDDILGTFAALGIGFCNIDQPIFHRSVRPTAVATSSVGYVRLHGRNYRNWFSPTANVRDRYDHLYSLEELEPWVARVKSIAEDAEFTYVVTNNHNLGKSTVNALQLTAFLSGQPVEAPLTLKDSYPGLRYIARDASV